MVVVFIACKSDIRSYYFDLDQDTLGYGDSSLFCDLGDQRDLFRKIISVNGIGPQIGMALLEDNEVSQFISAIQNNEINLLTRSQGVFSLI